MSIVFRFCQAYYRSMLFLFLFGSSGLAGGSGVEPGYNGGPAGGGAGCSACHPYSEGGGFVEFLGAPRRFQVGRTYNFDVLVADSRQAGAGFQISAETEAVLSRFVGVFHVRDALFTAFYAGDSNYLTHTLAGVEDSIFQWEKGGGSYSYPVRWEADGAGGAVERFTFFAAGNAVDDAGFFTGDHHYAAAQVVTRAEPGDLDGDRDVDLFDFALFQRCFGEVEVFGGDACEFADVSGDTVVGIEDAAAMVPPDGPTAEHPAGYYLADAARGGQLYDNWWTVKRVAPPDGIHPLYPSHGVQTGPVTFRCKECHGWDYEGRHGAYATGSHFTGIAGVFDTSLSPREVFDLLKAEPSEHPAGHGFGALGLTDEDLWDVTRMVFEATLDTDAFIVRPTRTFLGAAALGEIRYGRHCTSCHGADGRRLDFGTPGSPVYIGTLARQNPWEFLHKTRFGHPGTSMPALFRIDPGDFIAASVGAHAATLEGE